MLYSELPAHIVKGLRLINPHVEMPDFLYDKDTYIHCKKFSEADKLDLALEACTDIRMLAIYVWSVLYAETPMLWSRHLDVLCWCLHQLYDYNIEDNSLAFLIPSRCSKSYLCNVVWVIWLWLHDPSQSVLCLTGVQSTLSRDSVACRDFIQSEAFATLQDALKALYPTRDIAPLRLKEDQNVKTNYANSAQGSRVASLARGKYTGANGQNLVMDDMTDVNDVFGSANTINTAVEEFASVTSIYESAMRQRIRDHKTSRQLVIAQTLGEGDMPDFLINTWNFSFVVLPLCYEANHFRRSEFDWRTVEGEALIPELYPAKEIEKRRRNQLKYLRMDQQRYDVFGGTFFNTDLFETYSIPWQQLVKTVLPDDLYFASWDTSSSLNKNAKYTACTVFLLRRGRLYHVKIYRKRADTKIALALYKEVEDELGYLISFHLIEANSTGLAILDLYDNPARNYRVRPGPADSKAKRAEYTRTLMEHSRVVLNTTDPEYWNAKLEHTKFLTGYLITDVLDTFSQASKHVVLELKLDYSGEIVVEDSDYTAEDGSEDPSDWFVNAIISM